jgi:hypothetical protein
MGESDVETTLPAAFVIAVLESVALGFPAPVVGEISHLSEAV